MENPWLIKCFCCRWRFVIHGGIDGYSRLPVYCCCSTNNYSITVLGLFEEAVERYGLPSRVRCDRRNENVDVGFYMLNHPLRGPARGSIIQGGNSWGGWGRGGGTAPQLLANNTFFSGFHTPLTERYHQKWC